MQTEEATVVADLTLYWRPLLNVRGIEFNEEVDMREVASKLPNIEEEYYAILHSPFLNEDLDNELVYFQDGEWRSVDLTKYWEIIDRESY